MSPSKLAGVPKLDVLIKEARALGMQVGKLRRTGEWKVRTPDGHWLKLNARREDAPQVLIKVIRSARKEAAK